MRRAQTVYRAAVVTDGAESLLAQITAAASSQLDLLSGVLLAEITEQLPELAADPPLLEALAVAVSENLAAALVVFTTPEATIPPAPPASLDHARRVAQRGIPLSALLRAYRLGQAAFQQLMIAEIARASDDAGVVADAAARLSGAAFSYVDRTSGEVVQAYQTERDYWQRQRIAARSAQLDALLSGRTSDQRESERALGYVLDQQHVGVVLWDDRAEPAEDLLPALERSAALLAHGARCAGSPLVVARDVATVWAWLPSPAGPVTGSLPEGVRAAVGSGRSGLAGFRATHEEALGAQRVVAAAERSRREVVTRSEDLGPLALLCDDLGRLRGWVVATLGPLATDEPQAAALRDTLEVFLATGGSYLQTGNRLSLHRNSVQYRVRKAADLLGAPVEDRRLDLELALRACRVLGRPVLSAG